MLHNRLLLYHLQDFLTTVISGCVLGHNLHFLSAIDLFVIPEVRWGEAAAAHLLIFVVMEQRTVSLMGLVSSA